MPSLQEPRSLKLNSLPEPLRKVADELVREKFGEQELIWGIDYGNRSSYTTVAFASSMDMLTDEYLADPNNFIPVKNFRVISTPIADDYFYRHYMNDFKTLHQSWRAVIGTIAV
jgi:hypothetical protein